MLTHKGYFVKYKKYLNFTICSLKILDIYNNMLYNICNIKIAYIKGGILMFKIGDIVYLTAVTEEDKLHGRYEGERGIFQGYDNDVDKNSKTALVRFGDWGGYLVYEKHLMKLADTASIETIFKAFNMENEEELIERLKEFMEEGE